MKQVQTIQDIISTWKERENCTAVQYVENGELRKKDYIALYTDTYKISRYLYEHGCVKRHVVIIGKNSYEWLCAWFAVVNVGGVVIPLNKDLSAEEIEEYIEFCDTAVVLYEQEMQETISKIKTEGVKMLCIQEALTTELTLEEIQEDEKKYHSLVTPDMLASIVFTSGTTSKGKGAMFTQRAIMSGFESTDYMNRNFYTIMPMHHLSGLKSAVSMLVYGGIVSLSRSLKYFIHDLPFMNATDVVIVPSLLRVMTKALEKGRSMIGDSLQVVYSGGATFPSTCKWEVFEKNHIYLFQTWGATETFSEGTMNLITPGFSSQCLGKNRGTLEIKIVDNEIVVRGKGNMLGYYKMPEETAEVLKDGWYYTGDLGYIGEDGKLFMTGRKKNLIILSNGENISPEGIEAIISKNEEIQEVMVYENKDLLCAELFLAPSKDKEQQKKDIDAYILDYNLNVPTYRQIKKVVYREEPFEYTSTNKIKRYLIK